MMHIMIPLPLKPIFNRKSTSASNQGTGISGPKILNRIFWRIW